MENAMNEEKIQDLNRRNGISHHKKRLHRNARSGNGANGNGDEYLEEDGLVEGIQKETLNERAVSVLARVHEKLTGRDRIAYKIGSKRRTSHSGSSGDSSGSGSGSGSGSSGSSGGNDGGSGSGGSDQRDDKTSTSSYVDVYKNDVLDEPMDITEQVDKLINDAQSHENLAQMYIGWCPFW